MQDAIPTDLISTGKAAKILACRPSTVFRWCEAGRLRCWLRGTRRLVSEADVRGVIRVYEPPARVECRRPAPSRQQLEDRKFLRARGYDV